MDQEPSPVIDRSRMERARLERGLSKKALAEALGASLPEVWKWEHGHRMPRPARLKQIADVLGVTPGQLLRPPAATKKAA